MSVGGRVDQAVIVHKVLPLGHPAEPHGSGPTIAVLNRGMWRVKPPKNVPELWVSRAGDWSGSGGQGCVCSRPPPCQELVSQLPPGNYSKGKEVEEGWRTQGCWGWKRPPRGAAGRAVGLGGLAVDQGVTKVAMLR